jgi:hypothetical protein
MLPPKPPLPTVPRVTNNAVFTSFASGIPVSPSLQLNTVWSVERGVGSRVGVGVSVQLCVCVWGGGGGWKCSKHAMGLKSKLSPDSNRWRRRPLLVRGALCSCGSSDAGGDSTVGDEGRSLAREGERLCCTEVEPVYEAHGREVGRRVAVLR